MDDIASRGPISEGMEVVGSDGGHVGRVRTVWGGFTDLDSAIESELETGTGEGVETAPQVTEVPEGTSSLGNIAPSYVEVAASGTGTDPLYVPLSEVADITSDRVVLIRTSEEAGSGIYSQIPSYAD